SYLQAASDLVMLFMDRSVGQNIDDGLTCLSYASDELAPSRCKQYEHVDPRYSASPAEVDWSRPGGYDRSNWAYQFWPTGCDMWSDKVSCFLNSVDPVIAQHDVVSFQFSYLEVESGSTIEDQPGGFFWNNAGLADVYDLEAYEALHPGQVFIYWTTSLARGIGTAESESFNEQMRQYATAHGKPLFDVADILAHDPSGAACDDNRDGVAYDNGNASENYPDDGVDRPAICQHYTTEVDGGHLGSVSAGMIRVSKAFWVLMARIAGWDGSPSSGTPTPTPTSSPTPLASSTATSTPSPTPSPTSTPTASPTSMPPTATNTPVSQASPTPGSPVGDISQDGTVNIVDLQLCVNVVLGTENDPGIAQRADLNSDGSVNIVDVQQLVNIILGV
ncbi:MAG TPA: dockerin type I repeat-containing protein, partial [Anaerolineales bacterium]|nr:dockerin type I repeat-containing protein [Anaerolineales bacterium]